MLHLKELRTSRGLTQSELSKALNVSASSIGMYEQGRREPDNTTLKKIASYFEVTTDYLLGRSCPPNNSSLYQEHNNTSIRNPQWILHDNENANDWHHKNPETDSLTPDESAIIKAYRAAPKHIKDIVNTALKVKTANPKDIQT